MTRRRRIGSAATHCVIRRRLRAVGLALVVSSVLGTASVAELEVPFLGGRVNDLAGLLAPEVEVRIETTLRALEEETGSQVAVLTVPSLEGESLEGFSLRVVETWQLGRREVNDGALLFIARDDRKMWIEVGYGLEGSLTDARTRRILDDILRPNFRIGDFEAGVEEAVEAISGLIRGEAPLPAPDAGGAQALSLGARVGSLLLFTLVVVVFSAIAIFSQGLFGWFLYAFLMLFWGTFPGALIGARVGWVALGFWVVAFPILWFLARRTVKGRKVLRGGGWGRAFSGAGVGWSTLRGWSGGFSSDGFSGGGGSFGGGRSSGGW